MFHMREIVPDVVIKRDFKGIWIEDYKKVYEYLQTDLNIEEEKHTIKDRI